MEASAKKQEQKISEESVQKADNQIDSIKESINKDLDTREVDADDNTKKLPEEKEKNKGLEHTYYSDMSDAMGSNEPATISELLRKDRYKKKEKEVFKNKHFRSAMK